MSNFSPLATVIILLPPYMLAFRRRRTTYSWVYVGRASHCPVLKLDIEPKGHLCTFDGDYILYFFLFQLRQSIRCNTRCNTSYVNSCQFRPLAISFVVFCLNKKALYMLEITAFTRLLLLELLARIELATTSLRVKCSTIEPQQQMKLPIKYIIKSFTYQCCIFIFKLLRDIINHRECHYCRGRYILKIYNCA